MDKVTFKDILDPVSPDTFFKEYWGKKHLIIRRNKFKDLFNFEDLNNYLNQYPDIKGLQILNYDNKDTRWCLDKVKKKQLNHGVHQPMLSKDQVYKLWLQGKTFVIPLMEYQKKSLVDICFAIEQYFGTGQANVYASPKANSKSFPAHADSTENFLFHTEGKTKWTIYKEFKGEKPKTILEQFILEPGDLLYIPTHQYHEVNTIGARILISVHFKNKPNQSLEKFAITSDKQNNRNKWYDWRPYRIVKKPVIRERLMNKSNWSKPYFNKKI